MREEREGERERWTEIKFRLDSIRACVELKKCCTFIFPSLLIPKWWSFSLPAIDRAINRVACASKREGGGREGEAPSCKCWLLLRLALTTADVWLPSWAVYLWIDQFKFARLLTDRLAGTFTWIKTKKEFIFWHYVASREEYFFNYCSGTVQQPRPLQSASFSLLRFNYRSALQL